MISNGYFISSSLPTHVPAAMDKAAEDPAAEIALNTINVVIFLDKLTKPDAIEKVDNAMRKTGFLPMSSEMGDHSRGGRP